MTKTNEIKGKAGYRYAVLVYAPGCHPDNDPYPYETLGMALDEVQDMLDSQDPEYQRWEWYIESEAVMWDTFPIIDYGEVILLTDENGYYRVSIQAVPADDCDEWD